MLSRRDTLLLGAAFCAGPIFPVLRLLQQQRRWEPTKEAEPYFPGTVIRRRLSPLADTECAMRYVIGPYCRCRNCGLGEIWLFTETGRLDRHVNRSWVEAHFEILHRGRAFALYTFPEPWPPFQAGAA
jgi:hypothetical protein